MTFFSGNRSYRVPKMVNFMLISELQICLCDKMLPKKLKLKNGFLKILNLNFLLEHFVTKAR
jgi:hypothetical protein